MKTEMGFYIKTDNTEAVKNATRLAVYRALNAVGLQAEGYAKRLCPVDTGNLRNSITHGFEMEGLTAFIGTNVEYAAYVEYGTSRTKAQPYIKPAVQNHAGEYSKIFQAYLKNA